MEFRALGTLEVAVGGRALSLAAAKPRALLAILLLRANELVPADRLIEQLWDGDPPASAHKVLQTYISQLRRELGADRIVTRNPGYLLRAAEEEVDLERFERLRRSGQPHEALALWRGEPLADFAYERWAQPEIARLEEARLATLEDRIDVDLADGRHAQLAPELEALVERHPLRERPRAQWMLALYRSGRQAEALEVYRKGRRLLVDELGIEPGPALQKLNRAILAQEGSLGLPAAEPKTTRTQAQHPGYATAFIGRRQERQELARLFRDTAVRLVTLTGPGGTGKTRLAHELVSELTAGFRNGAVFVDLVPVGEAELVPAALAGALGLHESGGSDPLESLAAFLRGRETLLVLDNFEHVLSAAGVVSELLQRTTGPRLLVTSRAPLHAPGEHVYAVPPLALPALDGPLVPDGLRRLDAVRLFVDRAKRARDDFELTALNAPSVAELCVRLDGLPLALELAAARVKLLSQRAIVERLGQRLDLLRDEGPDAHERHRSLRAAIEWSHDLLTEREQQLFSSLGAFSGGFALDAAEAVAASSGLEVIADVESLLDNSLLRRLPTAADEPRFGMLETIREYAVERLAARPDQSDVRRRHARHFLALAEQVEPELRAGNQLAWLERIDAENENLRAALDWVTANGEIELGLRGAAGLWRFWQTRSLNGEGRERLDRLLALDTSDVDSIVLANAIAAAGRLAFIMRDYDTASLRLNESQPVHLRAGTAPWAAMSAGILGLVALTRSADEAAPLIEASVDLARASHDWWAQSVNLSMLGELHRARNELPKARLALEECLRASRECGDLRNIGRALSLLGLIMLAQHEHERARSLFEEALEVQRTCADAWNISRTLANLGLVAEAAGDRAEAGRKVGEALAMQAESNDRDGVATSLALLAELAAAAGRPGRAVRLFSAAEVVREEAAAFPMNQLRRAPLDLGALRDQLGADAFDESWSGGRSMMLDEVVRYAAQE